MSIFIQRLALGIPLIALVPSLLLGVERLFYKELNLVGGYSQNDKTIGKSDTLKNSVGFEDYRKFSSAYGDFLTSDFQVRLTYDNTEPRSDAFAVEIHNAWLEYKAGFSRKVKVGHFDPAFGLEPTIDTHGTLLQTLAMKNIGFKKDWGLSVKQIAPSYEYESAIQLGSGMNFDRQDGSYLVTTRVGLSNEGNFQYGISGLVGQVLQPMQMQTIPKSDYKSNQAVKKKRIGLDGQYLIGPVLFKAEGAYGSDENHRVFGFLSEVDYTVPNHQDWELELQAISWVNNIERGHSDDSRVSVGTSYRFTQVLTLRALYIRDIHLMEGHENEKVLVQAYYFGL